MLTEIFLSWMKRWAILRRPWFSQESLDQVILEVPPKLVFCEIAHSASFTYFNWSVEFLEDET